MRDPKRIYKFCNELASMWSSVPDLRFGQLIEILRTEAKRDGFDPFVMEDDEALEYISMKMKKISGRYVYG